MYQMKNDNLQKSINHIYLNSWFSPNMLYHYARYKFNYVHEHIDALGKLVLPLLHNLCKGNTNTYDNAGSC